MKRLLLKISLSILCIVCLCAGISCTQTQNHKYVSAPQNVVLSELEVLSWDPVDNADEYSVCINDKEYFTNETTMDLFTLLNQPGDYEICVCAYPEYIRGEPSYSGSLTYKIEAIENKLLYREIGDGEVEVKAANTTDLTGKVIIPETIEGNTVVKLGHEAFMNCENITSILVPNSVRVIGSFVFTGCTSLRRAHCSENAMRMPSFYNCTALEQVDLPEGVKEIRSMDFYNCISLRSITLPSTIEVVSGAAFEGASNLETIVVSEDNSYFFSEGNCIIDHFTNELKVGGKNAVIPNGIEKINKKAFSGRNITSIDLPQGLEEISEQAFSNCSVLKELKIPESVKQIGEGAFMGCTSLESMHIPKNVQSIGSGFLAGCTNLKTLTVDEENPFFKVDGNCILEKGTNVLVAGTENAQIPQYVTEIGSGAFAFCTFKTISLPEGIEIIQSRAFFKCANLERITIPTTVKKIRKEAFAYCTHLMIVRLPEGVETIEDNAFFASCNPSFLIPDSVTYIGYGACPYLDIYTPCIPSKEGWQTTVYRGQISWHSNGNLIQGCQYGYDGAYPYVTQFTVSVNLNFPEEGAVVGLYKGGMTVPYREGYIFKGWSKEKDGEIAFKPYDVPTKEVEQVYESVPKTYIRYAHQECFGDNREEFDGLPNGTILYAIWEKVE